MRTISRIFAKPSKHVVVAMLAALATVAMAAAVYAVAGKVLPTLKQTFFRQTTHGRDRLRLGVVGSPRTPRRDEIGRGLGARHIGLM